jgi:hypothetical protein
MMTSIKQVTIKFSKISLFLKNLIVTCNTCMIIVNYRGNLKIYEVSTILDLLIMIHEQYCNFNILN